MNVGKDNSLERRSNMTTTIKKDVAKKLVKAANRKISRANLAFQKMKPSEKRIQIARDVLAQLVSKRLMPKYGVWLAGAKNKFLFSKNVEGDSEVKDIFAKVKQCEGCALGGMFMCAVERADKLKMNQLQDYGDSYGINIGTGDTFSYMKKFFSKAQLEMIECAFEAGNGSVRYGNYDAVEFVRDIDEPGERMRLIMENIVVNKGTFKPAKAPVSHWTTPGFKN